MLRVWVPFWAAATMLGASVGASPAGTTDELLGWTSVGPAHAVALTRVEEIGTWTEFSFTNSSARTVTAYALSFTDEPDDSSLLINECFVADASACLAPGATYRMRRPTSNLGRTRTVRMWAAVFDDGSGEGAQTTLDAIRYWRVGVMMENERLNLILGQVDGGHASDDALVALRSKVGKLPASPDEAFASVSDSGVPGLQFDRDRLKENRIAFNFFSGVRSARGGALRDLDEVARRAALAPGVQGASSQSGVLSQLQQKYQERTRRFRVFAEGMRRKGINQ